jgi:hypothetical protein
MTNVIKFQAPFERIKHFNEGRPDVGLRIAIIIQAIIDASNSSSSPQAKKLEIEAKEWLFGNSEGFQKTCYEANLEPDFVVRNAKDIIKLHHAKSLKDETIINISEKFNSLLK